MRSRPEPRPGDILAALGELGLLDGARVTGSEAYILCPYHDDHQAGSFAVNLDSGLNHCFACGNGGSFHRLLTASRGMSRTEARRWCLNRLIATTTPERHVKEREEVSEASLALLTAPPEEALAHRGVTIESCMALEVLWNPDRKSWVFPVRDPHTGKLLGWQEKIHRFMSNQPEDIPIKSTLFGWHRVVTGSRVVLVESPLDTAVMLDAGYTAVSSFGSVVSPAQLALITETCTALVLALDDDKAGWQATDEIMRHLRGIPVQVFNYGDSGAKDPGDMDDERIRWGMTNLLC